MHAHSLAHHLSCPRPEAKSSVPSLATYLSWPLTVVLLSKMLSSAYVSFLDRLHWFQSARAFQLFPWLMSFLFGAQFKHRLYRPALMYHARRGKVLLLYPPEFLARYLSGPRCFVSSSESVIGKCCICTCTSTVRWPLLSSSAPFCTLDNYGWIILFQSNMCITSFAFVMNQFGDELLTTHSVTNRTLHNLSYANYSFWTANVWKTSWTTCRRKQLNTSKK